MTLPGISGRKLLDELRKIRPDIRIILTTAYSKEMASNTLGSPRPGFSSASHTISPTWSPYCSAPTLMLKAGNRKVMLARRAFLA